jgi:hypothetical protein
MPPPSGDQATMPRQQILFGRTLDQTVLDLQPGNGREAAQLGDGGCTGNAPGGKVGDAGIENLAGARQIVEAAHDLLGRRYLVRQVQPIEIDAVGLQPLQAGLDRLDHGLAAVADGENTGRAIDTQSELGGEHEIVATPFQQMAEQLFRFSELVGVGRVDEVTARFDIALEDAACLRGIRAVAPFGAEIAGTEHKLRDAEASMSSEQLVAHGGGLSS